MIQEKKLPKPTNNPDNIPNIEAKELINRKTGMIIKKKQQESMFTYPSSTTYTTGSGISPEYMRGYVDCETIKSKVKNIMQSTYNSPTIDDLLAVFWNERFPRNAAFRCSYIDCMGIPAMPYINDFIVHGQKAHNSSPDVIINVLLDLIKKIELK